MTPPPSLDLPEDLQPAAIEAALTTARYGRSLHVLAIADSTNDVARAAAAEGKPDGHVVVADSQRVGRGARGRAWASPPGVDLYLSIVARLPLPLTRLPPLTLAVGLSTARTAEAFGAGEVAVKWPNDVLLAGQKAGGILVETATSDHAAERPAVIIGIGLNVNRSTFSPELTTIATSLRRHTGKRTPRHQVLPRLLAEVESALDLFVQDGPAAIVPAIESRLAYRGQVVDIEGQRGRLAGLAPDGALRLDTPQGPLTIRSGSIRWVGGV